MIPSRPVAPPEDREALEAEAARLRRLCEGGKPVRLLATDFALDFLHEQGWPVKVVGKRRWSSPMHAVVTPVEVARAPDGAGEGATS